MADLLQALQSVRPPPPPLIDRSSLLPRPPQQVGPATVPGLVKLQAQVAKELAGSDKLLATSDSRSDLAPPSGIPYHQLPSHESSSNAPHLVALVHLLAAAPYPLTGINQTYQLLAAELASSDPQSYSLNNHDKAGSSTSVADADLHPGLINNAVRPKYPPPPPPPPREVHVTAVCEGGRRWVKSVSSLTVLRLGLELGENDDSDSDSDSLTAPSSRVSPDVPRAHTTLHSAAHALRLASSALPKLSPLTPQPEIIELHLPRFTPKAIDRLPDAHRQKVESVLDEVRSIPGVEVSLGPARSEEELNRRPIFPCYSPVAFQPTQNVVLDLSLLIALLSHISHMPLPPATDGPEGVFLPLVRQYRKDGSLRSEAERKQAMLGGSENAKALTVQLGIEMAHPLVDELVDGLALALPTTAFPPFSCSTSQVSDDASGEVICWATQESADRLQAIVRKLASPSELLRAQMIWAVPGESPSEREARTTAWWAGSRANFSSSSADAGLTKFHRALADVRLLPASRASDPFNLAPLEGPKRSWTADANQRPFVELHHLLTHLLRPPNQSEGALPKLPPSLTPHTVRTLLAASSRGWTVLTTNRASLARLWKYIEEAGVDPSLGSATAVASESISEDGARAQVARQGLAVAWLLEPRSLAESMRV